MNSQYVMPMITQYTMSKDQECDPPSKRTQKAFAISYDVLLHPLQLYHSQRYQRCFDGNCSEKWCGSYSIHQNLC